MSLIMATRDVLARSHVILGGSGEAHLPSVMLTWVSRVLRNARVAVRPAVIVFR